MRSSRKKKPTGPPLAVIEEVADDIYSVKFILQSLGYRVLSLSFREDFLPRLLVFKPRMVIVDMMIPKGHGFEVIRRVHAVLEDVPILAITADAMEGEEEDVLKAGGKDWISKPYAVADLQSKLSKHVPEEAKP